MGGGPQHIYALISLMRHFNFYVAAPKSGIFFNKFSEFSSGYLEIPYRKFSLIGLLNLVRAIKKWKIDLIHSHGRGAGVFSRIAGLITNVPVIHTHHGFFFKKNVVKKCIQIAIEFFLNKLTIHTIFVSSSEKYIYLNNVLFSNIKFSIVPNGVSIPKSIHKKSRGEQITLITVTRLEPEKGNSFLLIIMNLLLKINKNIELIIVGDGPLRIKLETMARKLNIEHYVQFLGVRTDVSTLLQSSDIFISCSLSEAQGIAVLEAMSYEVPVVVSNVPGHIDYIVSGVNGLLFNLNDHNKCVYFINQIISDPEYAYLLSKNAKNTVINNFSTNSMINSMNNIYCNFSQLRK